MHLSAHPRKACHVRNTGQAFRGNYRGLAKGLHKDMKATVAFLTVILAKARLRAGAESIFAVHTLDSGFRRSDGGLRSIFMVMTENSAVRSCGETAPVSTKE